MTNLMTVKELIEILEKHDKNEFVYLYSWTVNYGDGECSVAELSFDLPPYETIMECEN